MASDGALGTRPDFRCCAALGLAHRASAPRACSRPLTPPGGCLQGPEPLPSSSAACPSSSVSASCAACMTSHGPESGGRYAVRLIELAAGAAADWLVCREVSPSGRDSARGWLPAWPDAAAVFWSRWPGVPSPLWGWNSLCRPAARHFPCRWVGRNGPAAGPLRHPLFMWICRNGTLRDQNGSPAPALRRFEMCPGLQGLVTSATRALPRRLTAFWLEAWSRSW